MNDRLRIEMQPQSTRRKFGCFSSASFASSAVAFSVCASAETTGVGNATTEDAKDAEGRGN